MNLENKIQLTPELQLIDLQRMDYAEAFQLQKKLQEQRINDKIPNTILFVEHNHVYTLGKDLADEQALIKNKLPAPLEKVNRGGKITYHGPGQLVTYFIFKVPQENILKLVDRVENLTLTTLKEYRINAYSRKEEKDSYGKNIRGAWFKVNNEHKKIAAQGIATKKTNQDLVTMHGFALNVNTNLDYFNHINPCGFTYPVMSSMQEILNKPIDINKVKKTITEKLKHLF